jgi:hypothetical protein
MSTNIEYHIVIFLLNASEIFGARQLVLDGFVRKEVSAFGIVFAELERSKIDVNWQGDVNRGAGTLTSTLLGSRGGFGPFSEAKSMVALGDPAKT